MTEIDFDAAYETIEQARDWAVYDERQVLNEAHYILQLFEEWLEFDPEATTATDGGVTLTDMENYHEQFEDSDGN